MQRISTSIDHCVETGMPTLSFCICSRKHSIARTQQHTHMRLNALGGLSSECGFPSEGLGDPGLGQKREIRNEWYNRILQGPAEGELLMEAPLVTLGGPRAQVKVHELRLCVDPWLTPEQMVDRMPGQSIDAFPNKSDLHWRRDV
jgi:hypothetical protein